MLWEESIQKGNKYATCKDQMLFRQDRGAKRRCAQKIAEDILEILECDMASVSVAIEDVDREDWKAEVWDKDMAADKDLFYKKPGYAYG